MFAAEPCHTPPAERRPATARPLHIVDIAGASAPFSGKTAHATRAIADGECRFMTISVARDGPLLVWC
jgi:hypothetical protein